jgi:hypothetical protein
LHDVFIVGAAAERGVEPEVLAGGDHDGLFLRIEAFKREAHALRTRGHIAQSEVAAVFGGRAQLGADDGDDGVAQVFPGALVEHAAGDRAGGGILRAGGAREKRQQENKRSRE